MVKSSLRQLNKHKRKRKCEKTQKTVDIHEYIVQYLHKEIEKSFFNKHK